MELKYLTESGFADDKPTPNKSTGINVLEDLLKKIIPVLEIDYRQMTTSDEQRISYRAHIVNAVVTTLTPVEVNTEAGAEEQDLDEAVDIDILDDDDDKFIDIRTPEDQELFYDYLIANLKLYFDKFEDELSATVEEPTNKAYDDAKADEESMDDSVDPAELALEETIVWDI